MHKDAMFLPILMSILIFAQAQERSTYFECSRGAQNEGYRWTVSHADGCYDGEAIVLNGVYGHNWPCLRNGRYLQKSDRIYLHVEDICNGRKKCSSMNPEVCKTFLCLTAVYDCVKIDKDFKEPSVSVQISQIFHNTITGNQIYIESNETNPTAKTSQGAMNSSNEMAFNLFNFSISIGFVIGLFITGCIVYCYYVKCKNCRKSEQNQDNQQPFIKQTAESNADVKDNMTREHLSPPVPPKKSNFSKHTEGTDMLSTSRIYKPQRLYPDVNAKQQASTSKIKDRVEFYENVNK